MFLRTGDGKNDFLAILDPFLGLGPPPGPIGTPSGAYGTPSGAYWDPLRGLMGPPDWLFGPPGKVHFGANSGAFRDLGQSRVRYGTVGSV